jgi:glucose-6-phosphate 1-dehydrogenase
MDQFLPRCFYVSGQYDQHADFAALDAQMGAKEAALPRADRIFYLSIPPHIFTVVAENASSAASSK